MSCVTLHSSAQLNSVLLHHLRHRRLTNAIEAFRSNSHLTDITSWNLMLSGYATHGRPQCAHKMFDEMPRRDIVSWNTILSAFRRTGHPLLAFQHFLRMQRAGVSPNGATLTTMVAAIPSSNLIPQLHSMAIRTGLTPLNSILGTALVGGYASLEDPVSMRRAFGDIPVKNSVSWTSLISGYMELGMLEDAEHVFETMPVKNVVAWTTMMNGCIDNGKLNEARRYFDRMPQRNVITWTSMIKGYQRNKQHAEALTLFIRMRRLSDVFPNQFTYATVLAACAIGGFLHFGQSIHGQISRSLSQWDVVLSTSLVEMYGKCGDVSYAARSFDSCETRNVASWNSIIGCYAKNGLSTRALEEFQKMIEEGIRPDPITFVCVLTACVHGGLVDEGVHYFDSMERKFCIEPRLEHYGCMVDLLGRSGNIEQAENLIKRMPFEADIAVWGAFLTACGLHSNLEHGLSAVKAMQRLQKDHPVIYSMMLKVYGERGAWTRFDELKGKMQCKRLRKQRALSWIESTSTQLQHAQKV
ncbi:pentatricopeptide repeat-containing protein At4g02750-like [Zingiber officinale]|uniref:Pentatricopeptide repeat-containing protein n=1 Tax=Zingiber officinale TaxID=94328 RepID=A0A8J5KZI6_ZINOF|nr:pentatricopeptide repeat-containing protein At4g02750-like [Zingiber officinale]KAG6505103.1 hypothetical protein ZIOFF_037451 [Zingiber officinale]